MAKAVRIYNKEGDVLYYPVTIANEVYFEDGQRLNNIINGLQATAVDVSDRCLEVELELSNMKSDNATRDMYITDFENRLTDTEISINTINSDLATIKSDITQLKNSVELFRGIIDDLDQRIGALETETTTTTTTNQP